MEINPKIVEAFMYEQNNRPIPEFEGYSAIEMHHILFNSFEDQNPLQFNILPESDYSKIPIFNQIRYYLSLIEKSGEIKLTDKGFLPTKIVADIYSQGFLKDEPIEKGFVRLYKESDVMSVNLTRIIVELSGLIKKRNGKISLTKSAKKIVENKHSLLKLIFLTFARKFNLGYYDGFDAPGIGQSGFGFSLILLSNYGSQRRLGSFYAEKYFEAFPMMLDNVNPRYGSLEAYSTRCYILRTFERFLNYFGLIRIEKEGPFHEETIYITKTDLYDKLITCIPHKKRDLL